MDSIVPEQVRDDKRLQNDKTPALVAGALNLLEI